MKLFLYLCVSIAAFSLQAKTTVADVREHDYDVQYVKMEISATNLSTQISGHVLTHATVVAASMNEYVFELSPQLTIDSAKLNGQTLPVSSSGFVHTITLPASLSQNNLFTAEVYYHGQPTGGTGFFTNGILHQTDGATQKQVTHTVSAAFHSRDWWPCKQSLTDKIDSADLWITVPDTLEVAGNGLLQNITPLGNGLHRYEWHNSYPADYYLLSFAVSDYASYDYYHHFSNGDSLLIQNFVYDHPSVLAQHQDELDTIGLILEYFTEVFGDYPFMQEKFGICQMPLGGGMENQTMVSVGSLDLELIAHEMSHQWWGDNVTCAVLADMWLNEGFATYSEHLFREHFYGATSALAFRNTAFNSVMGNTGGSVFVTDTTDEFRIYDSRLTYYKGAALAHMLRFVIHNDPVYFNILKQYQQQFAYGNATTDNLKAIAESLSGNDLDTFFQQWYVKEGYPIYAAKWFQSGHDVTVRIIQTTSKPASVPLFKMPLEIKLLSAQGDTIIRMFNDQQTQDYHFTWSKTMSGMIIDPNNHVINKNGTITNDPSLAVSELFQNKFAIAYDSFCQCWEVNGVKPGVHMELFDMAGRKLAEQTATANQETISAGAYAPGNYILKLRDKKTTCSFHLLK